MRPEGCAHAPTRMVALLLKYSHFGVILDPLQTPFFHVFQGVQNPPGAQITTLELAGIRPKSDQKCKNHHFVPGGVIFEFIYTPV